MNLVTLDAYHQGKSHIKLIINKTQIFYCMQLGQINRQRRFEKEAAETAMGEHLALKIG